MNAIILKTIRKSKKSHILQYCQELVSHKLDLFVELETGLCDERSSSDDQITWIIVNEEIKRPMYHLFSRSILLVGYTYIDMWVEHEPSNSDIGVSHYIHYNLNIVTHVIKRHHAFLQQSIKPLLKLGNLIGQNESVREWESGRMKLVLE